MKNFLYEYLNTKICDLKLNQIKLNQLVLTPRSDFPKNVCPGTIILYTPFENSGWFGLFLYTGMDLGPGPFPSGWMTLGTPPALPNPED